MDYQIVSKSKHQCYFFIVILLTFKLFPYCVCIVNRDLVLTPKQGLQLSGKRIFYEESNNNESTQLKNGTSVHMAEARPWERTLKHVTYLTLFTNAANGIITGNFSKVKEYNNFLNSSYIRSQKSIDSRFGDIVLLAEGRLESMPNGSYRFMEGACDYECARESNIIALWHVQKIRHRDTADRKYHYEMKFSVSPLTTKAPTETIVRGGPNKRTIMEEQKNNVQTFIQTQDDYPQSFEKIIPSNEEDFLKRRYDAARNFRQVNQRFHGQQVTPIPQSTFLRGIYRNPPQLPKPQLQQQQQQQQHHNAQVHNIQSHLHQHQIPQTERLNTGEFYQGNYVPKASPKIELFPSLLNMFMGKPQRPLPPPTTFRPPTSQMKFPRPEIYALHKHPTQEFHKFHDFIQPYQQEQFKQTVPTSVPLVTHHYHHHYFMPNNSAISLEQVIQHNSAEHQKEQIYHNEVAEEISPQQHYITTKYDEPLTTTLSYQQSPQQNLQNNLNIQQQSHQHPQLQVQNYHQINYQPPNYNQNPYQDYQLMPPAPQKFIFPNTQIEQQHIEHVATLPSILKNPQYQQQQQQQQQQQAQTQPEQYGSYPYTTALEYTTVNIPLLISYPATINEEKRMDVPTPRNKPFLQSEPIDETIRYSEPDPLYANINDNYEKPNVNQYIPNGDHYQNRNNQEPQLETPEHKNHHQANAQQAESEADSKKEHSESIEAQLPAPNNNEPTKVQLNEVEISKDITEKEIPHEQTTSQSTTTTTTIKIVDENMSSSSEKPESANSIATENTRSKIFSLRKKRIGLKTGTTTPSTSATLKETLLPTTTTENIKLSTTSKPRKYFVSTSSTESPLRTISRYRNSYARTSTSTTTTTEKAVLKWTPKRKGYIAKSIAIKSSTPTQDNDDESESDESNDNDSIKADESNNIKNINFTMFFTTTKKPETTTASSDSINNVNSSTTTTSSLLLHTSPLTTQTETEIYEVLTQKSVSKSVSLKVGPNGEEIPVIIDDEENEVKNK